MTHFHLTLRKMDCWAQQCSSVVQHSGMDEGGSGIQRHPELHSKLGVNLGYMKDCLKKKKGSIQLIFCRL